MRDYVIGAILILVILLVPDKISSERAYAFDERQNEGKIAFIVNESTDEVPPTPTPTDKSCPNCDCKGTGVIKTGDGRTFDCPCSPDCPCKKKANTKASVEMGSTRSQEIPYEAYYVVKLTASWCGPCQAWNLNEKPKLKKVGLDVVEIDIDKNRDVLNGFKVNDKDHKSIPAFILCRKDNKKAYPSFNSGNVSGETLINKVGQLHKSLTSKVSQASPYYSQEELDALVRSSYNKNTRLMKAVMADGADVYSHLYNDHGFTKEQVVGLEYWVALALHDAVHPPSSITPRRN